MANGPISQNVETLWTSEPGDILQTSHLRLQYDLVKAVPSQIRYDADQLLATYSDEDERIAAFNMLWIAASEGDAAAADTLAKALSNLLDTCAPQDRPRIEAIVEKWITISKLRKPAGRQITLGKGWASVDGDSELQMVEEQFSPATKQAVVSPITLPVPTEPGSNFVVVLKGIGQPKSVQGQSLQRQFEEVVNVPVEKIGRLPEEGEILATVRKSWPWAMHVAADIERELSMIRFFKSPEIRLKPILFVGPEGTGKSSLARGLANVLGRRSRVLRVAGSHDSATLSEIPRGWATYAPCGPFQVMHALNCADPVIIIDELDKTSVIAGPNGSVQGALLNMIERPVDYFDKCLLAEVDLSHVTFIATVNSLEGLDRALIDRFSIYNIGRPSSESEWRQVIDYMRQAKAEHFGVDVSALPRFNVEETRVLNAQRNVSLRTFMKMFDFMLAEAIQRQNSECKAFESDIPEGRNVH